MSRRVIKKYANRRLYDVQTSRYITQAQLKDLIVTGAAIQVVDARSGDDLTREVLLQIVAEQEQLGIPILSETVLLALIRFYGHPMQLLASRYLEASLGRLVAQSQEATDRMQRATLSPVEFMNRMAQGGLDWLQQLQGIAGATPEHDVTESKNPQDRKKNR